MEVSMSKTAFNLATRISAGIELAVRNAPKNKSKNMIQHNPQHICISCDYAVYKGFSGRLYCQHHRGEHIPWSGHCHFFKLWRGSILVDEQALMNWHKKQIEYIKSKGRR